MPLRPLIALLATTLLSGCAAAFLGAAAVVEGGRITGVGEATFPAMMLVELPDGSEQLLTGDLEERINGRAAYTLTGPVWGECQGVEQRGQNRLTCADGTELSFATPVEGPKMSALHVTNARTAGGPVRLAFGWGRDSAREGVLRAALGGA
jgi:hypothetical protein